MSIYFIGFHGDPPFEDQTTVETTHCDATVFYNDFYKHVQCKRCLQDSTKFAVVRDKITGKHYVYFLDSTISYVEHYVDATEIAIMQYDDAKV